MKLALIITSCRSQTTREDLSHLFGICTEQQSALLSWPGGFLFVFHMLERTKVSVFILFSSKIRGLKRLEDNPGHR